MKFKLVFDGTSHADRIDDIGGQTGGCDAQMHADIQEDVTFGRGKGVTMEFVRFKEGKHFRYGFQRSGRRLDSSFNVVGKVHRTATGTGDLTQHPNSVQCPVQQFSAGQNADCGKTKTVNDAWGLTVKNDHFRPAPANPLVGNGENKCGDPPPGSAFSTDISELVYEYPTPPKFIFEPIPLHKMFNDRFHRFAVHFKTLNAKTHGQVNGILSATTDDRGNAEATVRFIRVK